VLILGIGLSVIGLGFFCWLLFNLAVYALPFAAGLTAGLAAYHSGAGPFGGILVGFVAGVITLVLGQIAFATVRSPLIRAAIALLFAAPATVAGYHATLGIAQISVPLAAWQEVFAVIGSVIASVTAWVRMAVFAEPLLGQGVAVGPAEIPGRRAISGTGATPSLVESAGSRSRRLAARLDMTGCGPSPRLDKGQPASAGQTTAPSEERCLRSLSDDWPTAGLHARVSIPSPPTPETLCGLIDIRHVFSPGRCSARASTSPLMA